MADEDIREGDPDKPRKRRPRDDDDYDDDDDDRPRRRRIRRDDDAMAGVIPYRNGMALAAYYSGIFGLIACFIGLGIFGAVPLLLGIFGLRKAKDDPEARGSAHAWVGIVLGAIELLSGCAVIGFFIFAGLSNKR